MKNSYEVAEVAELGRAGDLILGIKWYDSLWMDWAIGLGYFTDILDIDESDE